MAFWKRVPERYVSLLGTVHQFYRFYSEKLLKLGLSDNAGLATFARVTRNTPIGAHDVDLM